MSKIYISLGRLGDCINVLPMLYHEFQQGNRCSLMIAQEYSSLLDGCSYLDPISVDYPYWDVAKAFDAASAMNGGKNEIVVAQTNGPLELIEKYAYNRAGQKAATTDSFVKEQWKLAGKMHLWRKQPPLIFDKRDKERELQLLKAHLPPKAPSSKRKTLLVSLTGNTAPFPYADLLWELLTLKLTGWRIIDLSKVEADHFYDLLGLYESADALLCSDSAPLHLAQAVKTLPVLALINDQPSYWHGAPWRPSHVWHCRYGDFASRALQLFDVLQHPTAQLAYFDSKEEPNVFLCFTPGRSSTWNREFPSWNKNWLMTPLEPGAVGKDSTLIKDVERHPFLRSAMQLPLMRARPQDIVCLTKPTVCKKDNTDFDFPCYAYRMTNGQHHPAVDFFGATREFWEKIWPEIPDLIMGKDRYWEMVLTEIFKKNGAVELKDAIYDNAERTPKNAQYGVIPRIAHNQKIWEFLGLRDTVPAVVKQAQSLPLNPLSLQPYAYNPSICRVKNNLWITFRFHTHGNLSTHLGIAEIEPHGNANRIAMLPIPGHSVEDAKFFNFRGERWLSWVESDYSGQPRPNSVVKIGKLTDDWQVNTILHPDCPRNDWTGMQKNYVFFEHDGQLMCLYESAPNQTVYRIDVATGKCDHKYITEGAAWPWGLIKGGFIIETPKEHIRFFHSTLDNEIPPWRRRYYVGALLMDNKPPFTVLKISSEPLLSGSAADDLHVPNTNIHHYKGRVVFPGGAIRLDGAWMLAVGVNDCQCKLMKITDLKL